MGHAQRDLGAAPQGDLFGVAEDGGPPPYQVKPQHVRNRLIDMVETMQGAQAWPWPASRTKLFRQTVWPYLLGLLPQAEAADWRARLDAEAARLDG
jgi:hypothetical protein